MQGGQIREGHRVRRGALRVWERLFGGSARAQSETEPIEANQMEAQKQVNGRLGELFEDLGLALPNDAANEGERRELYAVVASVFAK